MRPTQVYHRFQSAMPNAPQDLLSAEGVLIPVRRFAGDVRTSSTPVAQSVQSEGAHLLYQEADDRFERHNI